MLFVFVFELSVVFVSRCVFPVCVFVCRCVFLCVFPIVFRCVFCCVYFCFSIVYLVFPLLFLFPLLFSVVLFTMFVLQLVFFCAVPMYSPLSVAAFSRCLFECLVFFCFVSVVCSQRMFVFTVVLLLVVPPCLSAVVFVLAAGCVLFVRCVVFRFVPAAICSAFFPAVFQLLCLFRFCCCVVRCACSHCFPDVYVSDVFGLISLCLCSDALPFVMSAVSSAGFLRCSFCFSAVFVQQLAFSSSLLFVRCAVRSDVCFHCVVSVVCFPLFVLSFPLCFFFCLSVVSPLVLPMCVFSLRVFRYVCVFFTPLFNSVVLCCSVF